jgi:hypothetical protein
VSAGVGGEKGPKNFGCGTKGLSGGNLPPHTIRGKSRDLAARAVGGVGGRYVAEAEKIIKADSELAERVKNYGGGNLPSPEAHGRARELNSNSRRRRGKQHPIILATPGKPTNQGCFAPCTPSGASSGPSAPSGKRKAAPPSQ